MAVHPPDSRHLTAPSAFAAWRDDGIDQVVHELLRCQVRERARRVADSTLVVLDTTSAHAAVGIRRCQYRPRSGQAGAGPQARPVLRLGFSNAWC